MIYKLHGSLQHYVWGGKDYLPDLLGFPPTQPHYAELWLGAHPSAPSSLEIDGKPMPLDQFLSQKPTALGTKTLSQFGQTLPYLLKILDVEKPLSIQLHPTKAQAELGFAAENTKGIALTDPKRTYKDANHKPEMMIALSDFWLLHGFKTKANMLETLKTRPSFADLAEKLQHKPLKAVYTDVMLADQAQLSAWLQPIIDANLPAYRNGELTDLHNPDYWLLYAMDAMNISAEKLDAGLVCFYLFNIVHTRPGEGIYQDAGIPHAYLRGQNIELMACSDNVIRGGLTPKYVDIPELLKVVDCREVEPQIIPAAPDVPYFEYHTPATDFALTHVQYQPDTVQHGRTSDAVVLLVMKGEVKIDGKPTALCLKQGESAFIEADSEYQLAGLKAGYAVIATLPHRNDTHNGN